MKKILCEYCNYDMLWINHLINENPTDDYMFHSHDAIEIILFLSGDIKYIIEGRQYDIDPDDLVVLAPNTHHRVKIISNTNYERYGILFNKYEIPSEIQSCLFGNEKFILQKCSLNVKEMFQKLFRYCSEFDKSVIEKLLVGVVTEIIYNIVLGNNTSNHEKAITTNTAIQKAIEYIDKNLMSISSLDEIYINSELSKCQFHRIFVKELGITPMEYIREKRLISARAELHQGQKATEIFQKCGFASYTAFYRAYKQKYGYAPSDESKKTYPQYKFKS